jgi:hypothetical protein
MEGRSGSVRGDLGARPQYPLDDPSPPSDQPLLPIVGKGNLCRLPRRSRNHRPADFFFISVGRAHEQPACRVRAKKIFTKSRSGPRARTLKGRKGPRAHQKFSPSQWAAHEQPAYRVRVKKIFTKSRSGPRARTPKGRKGPRAKVKNFTKSVGGPRAKGREYG